MINCPYCGKLTDPKLDGCPHCGGFLKNKVSSPVSPAAKHRDTCPSCSAVVQRGDIICVVCGTNLLTGQKVVDAPDPESVSNGIPLSTVLTIAAITLILVLGGIGIYMSNSDPVERARGLIAEFRYPEAQELLEEYIQSDPDNEDAMFELGKLQWRTKSFGAAAVSFQNVVEINPVNVEAGMLAVLSLQLSGTSGSTSREIAILEKLSEYTQDDAQVWLMLAMAKGARGEGDDYEDQYEALKRVLALSPGKVSARLDIGIGQALLGNYQRAKSELNQVSDPEERGNVFAFLGYIAALEQNQPRALDYFEKAINSDGLDIRWQAQTELARLRIQSGQFREAEKGLQEALQENPGNELGRYLLGLAFHSMGRANEALDEFELIMRGDSVYRAQASVQASSIQLLLGDVGLAERSINIAVKAKLKSPPYHTVLGRVHMGNNLFSDARAAFDAAIRMDPGYAPAYLERGLLYVKQDRLDQGLRDLNNYLNLLGRDVIGTKAGEIRLLTNQLQRTIETGNS